MKTKSKRTVPSTLAVLVSTTLLACLFASAATAGAQTGENAVFNSSGGTVASKSFLDATQFAGADVCTKINSVLTSGVASTYVVDARGVSTTLPCNMDPFQNATTPPAVILLPAGNIDLNVTWNPPSQTRIMGVGLADSGGKGTTLVAAGIASGGTMIQFPGVSGGPYGYGVSVEDLAMSAGVNTGVSAIVNNWSEEQSYVKHVTFVNFNQPVLQIGQTPGTSGAANSGPYENLYFQHLTNSCVVLNSNQTRGIHGMTCTGSSSLPAAGVLVDGSNNMIEDVHFEGFQDGILIGFQTTGSSQAFGDVISTVNGQTNTLNGPMTNVIHISNANVVQNLTLTGIQADAVTGTPPKSIKDDQTSTTLSDLTVGLYALGEPKAGGYSRFTTSPNAPAWAVGGTPPSGGCTVTNIGSLYSNARATTANTTLYICVPVAGTGTGWTALTIP